MSSSPTSPHRTAGAALASARRHLPLAFRATSAVVAALAIFLPLGQPVAVVFAALAMGAATWAGDRLASASVRAPVVGAGAIGLGLISVALANALPAWSWPVSILGIRGVTGVSLAILLAGLGGALLGGLRFAARRAPALVALEAAVFLVGVASVFAAHRHGEVLRPLWLSDWAWRRGLDPQDALRGFGAGAAALWLAVLFVDARSRLRWAALPLIAILAALPLVVGSVEDRGDTDLLSELGLTAETDGDRLPTQEGPARDGEGEGDDGEGQGGGSDENAGEEGGGGGEGTSEGEGGSEGGEGGEGGGAGDAQGEGDGGGASDDLENQQSPDGQSPEMRPRAVVLLGDDFEPPQGGFYFRQDAWSRRQGPRLVPATSSLRDRDLIRRFPLVRTPAAETPPMLERATVNATVGILSTSAAPFTLESALAIEPRPNPNPARFAHFYAFEAAPVVAPPVSFFGRPTGDPAWTEDERSYYLAAPDDPRYAELAQAIVAELPKSSRTDAWAQAVAVKLWMDREITYSLRHRHAGARDPTADFLFGDRIGYCVHIAHAVVYLYRTLGIPARIGVGYMVPAEGRHGSTVVVMESDAHAWPELYVDGVGWVILDVSPEQVIGSGPPVAEPDLADLLADMAREVPDYDVLDDGVTRSARPPLRVLLAELLRLALLAALAALWAAKLWRRHAWRFVAQERVVQAAWTAALDQTFEAGRARAWGESVHAWTRREAESLPSLDALARLVTEQAYAASPSARTTDRRHLGDLQQRLDRELARSVPLWRRLLGALDPTALFRIR